MQWVKKIINHINNHTLHAKTAKFGAKMYNEQPVIGRIIA